MYGWKLTSLLVMLVFVVTACGEDCGNQPPMLVWSMATPEGFEHTFDRSMGTLLTFSIADAVSDPEDDPLHFVWYMKIPDSEQGPVPVVGAESMTLSPCEIFSLQNAQRVDVTVVVSDAPLEFDKDLGPFPVASGGEPYAVRAWAVELLGQCP